MNHLYEDKNKVIHLCEMSEAHRAHVGHPAIVLVWTKCEMDVPANKSFVSDEIATCEKCKETP